jgi:phage gp29-like protein
MAQRFQTSPVPKGEIAKYHIDPYGDVQTQFSIQTGKKRGADDSIVKPNDELLIQKGGIQALNIYRRLLVDSTVQSAYSKLIQEVTSRELIVAPVSDLPGDLAVKSFVEYALSKLNLDTIFRGLLEAYVTGYSVAEIIWKPSPQGVIPTDIRLRDPRRFIWQANEDSETGYTMRMLTREHMDKGIELPARKFIVFRYWATHDGDPYGSGLGRILYPLVKFKRRALESEVLFSDRFATPTAIATAPLSATVDEINTLYSHISNLSQETALILPEGFSLEFANPQGSPEVFSGLRDSLTNEITTLIAGEAETGNKDAGSRASSEVAEGVRITRAKEISESLCTELSNTLIRWIVDLNYGPNVQSPQIYRQFQTQSDSKLTMADVAMMVEKIGIKPTTDWMVNHFKVDLVDPEQEKETGNITEPSPIEKQQALDLKKTETETKVAEKELAEAEVKVVEEEKEENEIDIEKDEESPSDEDEISEIEATDAEDQIDSDSEDAEIETILSEIFGDENEAEDDE